MSALFIYLGGVLTGIMGNLMTPWFARKLTQGVDWVAQLIDPNRFTLTGSWTQTYTEPDPSNSSTRRTVTETIVLTQAASHVTGKGTTATDPRTFEYTLTCKNNMVYGSYVKKSQNEQVSHKGSVVGTGMVQLIISPGIGRMKGQATWFDADTEEIESSVVTWVRQ